MKKALLVTGVVLVLVLGLASVSLAQSSPPTQIQYIQAGFYSLPPSTYPPGVSVAEVTSINQGYCGGKTGVLQTTRLGNRVTQMMVTDGGQDCSRAGTVSPDDWANLSFDNT